MLVSAECGACGVPWCGEPRASFAQTDVRASEEQLGMMSVFYLMMVHTHPAMGPNRTRFSSVKHVETSLSFTFGSSDTR